MNRPPYKAILFDLDGVLVDMPHAHFEALNKALNLFGATIEEEEHFSHFNGLPSRTKIRELEKLGRLPVGLEDFINEIKQQYTKQLIPVYCPRDYSKILMLDHLKQHGYLLGCCSNSTKETLTLMLTSAGLIDFFDTVIGNDEVSTPKPSPEIYLAAHAQLNVKPQECIVVEDSPHGLESARASGSHVYEVKNIQDVNLSLFKELLENGKV